MIFYSLILTYLTQVDVSDRVIKEQLLVVGHGHGHFSQISNGMLYLFICLFKI